MRGACALGAAAAGRAVVVLLGMLATAAGSAQDPRVLGLQIAIEAEERDSGWVDQRADLRMVLRDRQGRERERTLSVDTLEIRGDGDKSLLVFDSPRDIKGTALLTWSHPTSADEQWLYLPALKRVKRLASANKSGPFVGSEFAYEDFSSQEVAKYSYRWLRDEALDGRATRVVERIPAYQHSGYTRQVVWLAADTLKPLRVEYYDRKGALLKTLTALDYRRYLDRFWRAGRMEMINHQSGKSTVLSWENFRFDTGLGVRYFDRNSLQRQR
jgi:hypothetical protein